MNIAIIGTRGIPNHYGGFEQLAEYLSEGLVKSGHHVTVYNSHNHPYQEKKWKGVDIVHCYDPEHKIGTAGQFIYDLNCIMHVRKQNFDIILQLGYTSSTIWGWLLPRQKSIVTTNMDGLEWKRSKYSRYVQRFLLYAEKLGVRYSDHLIADSLGIQAYLQEKYQKEATYIAYGADIFERPDETILKKYQLQQFQYNMLIARMEPENNIETILDGSMLQPTPTPFIVIGNVDTKYGKFLKEKYAAGEHIRFLGGIYNLEELNNLRYYSNLYFHGHSVGGTNPSLLEAMASQAVICAHDNIFNRSVLENNGFYFSDAGDVMGLLGSVVREKEYRKIAENKAKIIHQYSCETIIDQYLKHFEEITEEKKVVKVFQYSRW
jgi:glycosyltransferase involved in cell wall biosynthesis